MNSLQLEAPSFELPEEPMLWVVWIDDNCGYGQTPNWEIDNPGPYPEEPLQQALKHAYQARLRGFPTLLLPPRQTPRPDGLFCKFCQYWDAT